MSKQKVRKITNNTILSMHASKTMKKHENSNREGKTGNTTVLPGRRAAKEEPPLMPKEQVIQVDDGKKLQPQGVSNEISSDQINQWADNLLVSLAPTEKLMLLLHATRGQKRPLPASSQVPEQTKNQFKKCLTRSFSACTDNPTRYNISSHNQTQNPQHKYLSSSPGNNQLLSLLTPSCIASTSLSSPPDFSPPIGGGMKKSEITIKTLARPTMPTGFSSSLVRSLSDSASQASSHIGIDLGETTKYQNAKLLNHASFTFNTELISTKHIYPIDPASSHQDFFPCPVSRFRKPQNTTKNFAQPAMSTSYSTPLACYKNTNDQNAIPSSFTFKRKSLNLTGDAKGSKQNEGIKIQSNLSESHSSQSPTGGQEKSTVEKKLSFLRQQTKCMTDILDSLCKAQALISNNVSTREAPGEISSENNFRTQCLLAKSSRNAVLPERTDDQVSLNRSSFRASLLTKRAILMTNSLKVLSGESLEGKGSRKLGQLASQKQSTKPHYRESERRSELVSKNYVTDGKMKENQINNTPEQCTTSCKLSTVSLQDPIRHTYSQQFPGEVDLTLGLRMPLHASDQETTATDNALSYPTTSHHQNSPKIQSFIRSSVIDLTSKKHEHCLQFH